MLAADPGDSDHVIPPVSLYVHVPFCVSKCAYCDFCSQTLARAECDLVAAQGVVAGRLSADPAVAFVDRVLSTIDWIAEPALADVPTVYFGGGTPTVLGDELVRLVEGVRERAGVRTDAEITVETNPGTTTPELVAALVASGVNRFSLGVQSFDDAVLRTLGRAHDAACAAAACEVLSRSGVPFSVDLMCGVPGQDLASWSETLEKACSTGAVHASVYPLAVEEGTPLAAEIEAGTLPGPSADLAARMMLKARDRLAARGMRRYEVANYAVPGQESRHNLVYWTGGAYIGIGPSAASMMPSNATHGLQPQWIWGETQGESLSGDDHRVGQDRFTMNETLVDFVQEGWDRRPAESDWLSDADTFREHIMLAMRLTRGVAAWRVEHAGLADIMSRLQDRRLVERFWDADDVESWRTTDNGWLLGNEVFGALWTGE